MNRFRPFSSTLFSRSTRLVLGIGLALVPVLVYFGYVWASAFFISFEDDMALVVTVNATDRHSLADLPRLLYVQHNDHRIVFSRAAALLSYQFFGYLNFRAVAIAGYFNLLLIGLALYNLFRTTHLPFRYFLPVPFLLFSPHLYQISLWSVVSFQPPLAAAFSLWSLYLLYRPGRWGWALGLAVLATFASGNGVVVFVAGAVLLAVQGRFRTLAGWVLGLGLTLGAYFLDFRFSGATQLPPLAGLAKTVVVNVVFFVGSYLKIFTDSRFTPLVLLGTGVLLVYGLLFFRRVTPDRLTRWLAGWFPLRANWLLHAALLTSMGTAGLIALTRSGGGPAEMTSDRFHLYSVVLLIVFYLVLIASLSDRGRRMSMPLVLALALISNAYAYLHYEPARAMLYNGLRADAHNYLQHRRFIHQYAHLPDPDPVFYRHCRFPAPWSEAETGTLWKALTQANPTGGSTVQLILKKEKTTYDQPLYPMATLQLTTDNEAVPQSGVLIALADSARPGQVYAVSAWRRASLGALVRRGQIFTNWFSITFPHKLPPGAYRVGLFWWEAGQLTTQAMGTCLLPPFTPDEKAATYPHRWIPE